MPSVLTPGDGQDLLARLKRGLEKRDPDALMELFRADAEYRTDPFEPALSGANAIRERFVRAAAAEDHVEFDAERVWVSGRAILASWHGATTLLANAERVRRRGFMTVELD